MGNSWSFYAKPGLRRDGALDVARLATSPLVLKHSRIVTSWSDPATWGARLPLAGESVIVPAGRHVLLDVSPPPLAGLQVDGVLIFDDRALTLAADWILVRGELRIGSASQSYAGQATIVLTGHTPRENASGLGTQFLAAMSGGLIEFYGEGRDWRTKLDGDAGPGATQILLEHIPDWRPGEQVVIGRADSPAAAAEVHTIAALHHNVLTLSAPLTQSHCGTLQTLGSHRFDQRAMVALLTRNIVVRGEAGPKDGPGAYLRIMPRSRVQLSGIEVTGLGGFGTPPLYVHPQAGAEALAMSNSSLHHNTGLGATLDRLGLSFLKSNFVYGWT
jgi:cell migration-inducing and hyaluronan-binding protein